MSAMDHTGKQYLTAFGEAGDVVFGRSPLEVRQLEIENPQVRGQQPGLGGAGAGRDLGRCWAADVAVCRYDLRPWLDWRKSGSALLGGFGSRDER